MADPTPYKRSYSFTNYQADSPGDPLPGNRLDTELDDIAARSDALTRRVNAGIRIGVNQEAIETVATDIDLVAFVAQNMPDIRIAADAAPALQSAASLFLGAHNGPPLPGIEPFLLGATYYDTATNQSYVWGGSGWVQLARMMVGGIVQGAITVSGDQTTFEAGGDFTQLTVSRNGALLTPGVGYTTASPFFTVPSAIPGDVLVYFGPSPVTVLTPFARSLLDDPNAATARSTLGAVGIGRQVNAGDGLVGGGALDTDRTIALGTPGSITATSTNTAADGTHTHELTASTVGRLMADLGVGAIGTIALMRQTGSSTTYNPGETRAASGLRYASVSGEVSPATPSGTWRALSYVGTGNTAAQIGLWQRIA